MLKIPVQSIYFESILKMAMMYFILFIWRNFNQPIYVIVFLLVTELNSFLIPLMSSAGDLRSDWGGIFVSWQNSRPVHYLCYHCGIPGVFQHIYFSSWIGVPLNQKVQNNHYYLNIIPGIICGPSCMDYGKCPLSYIFKRVQFVLSKVHSSHYIYVTYWTKDAVFYCISNQQEEGSAGRDMLCRGNLRCSEMWRTTYLNVWYIFSIEIKM